MKLKEQKEKIISAARECFARYGYEKTTMEDIGNQVGLNKTSLYHYFHNKDKIFTEVILQEKVEYFEAIQLKIKNIKKCDNVILTYLEERLLIFPKVPALASITIETIRSKQNIFKQLSNFLYKIEIEFLSDIIKDCINKGEFKECDPSRVAQSIITVADAIKMKAVKNINITRIADMNFSEIKEELIFTVSLMLNGLKK